MPYPVRLNGLLYSHEQLLAVDPEASSYTSFESGVISFYQYWHSPADVFTFQTSGTTGTPKKINFNRRHLIHSAQCTLQAFGLHQGTRILLCLPPSFVAGKLMIVRVLVGDLQLIAREPVENPLASFDEPIDFMAITPQQLFSILKDEKSHLKFQQIGKVIVGGGAINGPLMDMLSTCTNEIYHTYAMTETLTHIAIRKVSGKDAETDYHVLPGFEIKPDDRNCLMIKTPYHPHWIATNDIVELTSATSFLWLGRHDNVINSGGIKVIPEEIEPLIGRYFQEAGMTNRFFITGLKDSKLGEKVVLVIEGQIEKEKEQLIKNLKGLLPMYKSPKDVILTGKFETTTTGKINRLKTIQNF